MATSPEMECGICCRELGPHRRPLCASCARASIYEQRFQQVTSLLDKERLHKQVQTLVSPPTDLSTLTIEGAQLVEVAESVKKLEVEQQRIQIAVIDERLHGIREQQDLLKEQIRQSRVENEVREAGYKKDRSDVGREVDELNRRKPQLLEPIKAEIKRLENKLVKVHNRTVEGRSKLCEETARLAGLRQQRRTANDGSVRVDYMIGTINILDLRELNTANPDQVTASLANICRLLTTCCHYLSVRLPAEVILPRSDVPHPSIMSLQASYQGMEGFLTTAPSQSIFQTSTQSRLLAGRSRPKLRLLYLDRPLPRLAKEDPATYNLFIEGVALLAWDVAWLCRSQGAWFVETWEDICNMGRNIFQLFLGDRSNDVEENRRPSGHLPDPSSAASDPVHPKFGELSHATSDKNLAGPEGMELMRTWQIPSLARIIDKTKSHLLTEMSGAEWELLDEKEWNEDRDDEQAVLVGGQRLSHESRIGMSLMTTAEDVDGRRGGSGWTKLKSRGGDDA